MSIEHIISALTDAFSLLDFSERLLDEVEDAPLSELPRIINLLKKNIRDAKALINDAEAELDDMVKKTYRREAEDLTMYDEWANKNEELLKEISKINKSL
ncbi:MAG: hypothetical protein H0Z19_11265 [Archaeoglobus sp.]|uniref:hypothetical protein n=1 Tax=Archaeoglobus sp. TaxID=1872626 RepID=UPI001DA5A398|nr:hypothetical protein [Archaeoglobus sp.]MBO8181026.1 hypothetical protein [Archaeoglobus sp.]